MALLCFVLILLKVVYVRDRIRWQVADIGERFVASELLSARETVCPQGMNLTRRKFLQHR